MILTREEMKIGQALETDSRYIDCCLIQTKGVILKLFFLAVCAAMLAGCAMQLPHVPELGYNWVSMEGKSQEQLDQDQTACMREVKLFQSLEFSGPGGVGWGMSEMRAFDDCMRSKGWVKK